MVRAEFCTLLAGVMLLSASGCSPKGTVSGWASENEHRVSFSSEVAWWNAVDHTVTVGFLPSPPNSQERSKILKDGSFFMGMDRKLPLVELHLTFKPDAVVAGTATLERYHVFFRNYSESFSTFNFQFSDWAQDGGILELSGALRHGAKVKGHFKREQVSQFQRQYQWDLSFDVPLE